MLNIYLVRGKENVRRESPLAARAFGVFLALISGLTLPAQNAHFTSIIVIRTGDRVAGRAVAYLGSPAINNKGLIVFTARFEDDRLDCVGVTAPALCVSAIVTSSQGSTRMVVKAGDRIDGQTLTWISDPVSLNDAGTVAFAAGTKALETAARRGQHVIFTENHLIAKPGDRIDGCTLTEIGAAEGMVLDPRPVIGERGEVYFSANYASPCRGGALGTNLFTQQHVVRLARRPGGFFDVSARGVIGALTDKGIYDRAAAIVQYGSMIDGERVDGIGPPAINNAGRVVFAGQFGCKAAGCVNGVATRSKLIAREGQAIAGLKITEFWTPLINNRDAIVFRGLIEPEKVNFLLYSSELGVIAKPGDMIGGHIVASIGRPTRASYAGMNDEGQVVFLATFADGSEAIVLARP